MISFSPAALVTSTVPLISAAAVRTPEGRPPLAYRSPWYCWALRPVEMDRDARLRMETPVMPSVLYAL